MTCQNCASFVAPALPMTRGAPVLPAVEPVVFNAASVKLGAVSKAPEPRPSHQGPGVARCMGDAMAERMTARTVSAANIVVDREYGCQAIRRM